MKKYKTPIVISTVALFLLAIGTSLSDFTQLVAIPALFIVTGILLAILAMIISLHIAES